MNSRPHRFFFICLIPYENKVHGFVSVVVMIYKFKKHDLMGVLNIPQFLTTSVPLVLIKLRTGLLTECLFLK